MSDAAVPKTNVGATDADEAAAAERRHAHDVEVEHDNVVADEWGDESFPASDPPAY
ncbi:hypothetical protein [Dietzia sp.]|uniref:hypothetical protein n=1 Tax=Dietzia sp. TaxID=1871616 RepID=UPI002FDB88FF